MSKKQIIILISIIATLMLVSVVFYLLRNSKKELLENIEAVVSKQEGGVLSENGRIAKKKIVNSLGGKAGTLLATDSMEIGYLNPPDERIMIFISDTAVEKTESDAIHWLLSRGFSRADLCLLPVVFSIDNPEAQTEETYKLSTNYLPPYCFEEDA